MKCDPGIMAPLECAHRHFPTAEPDSADGFLPPFANQENRQINDEVRRLEKVLEQTGESLLLISSEELRIGQYLDSTIVQMTMLDMKRPHWSGCLR